MLYEIISFVCIFIATIFVYVKFYAFKYWSEKGVEYLEPGFPFGNISQNFIGAIDYGSLLRQFYQKINGKFGGFFKFHQPVLLIKDTDLIKQILVKDFDHFSDRGIHVNKKDPLSANLFSLSGDEWLNLKNKLIPTFTTEKLKMLFLSIADRNGVMETFLIKHCNNDANYKVDMRDLLDRLTINVIASLAFGVEIDCINNPRNLFRKMCNKAVIPNVKMILMITLSFLSPKLLKWINFKTNDDEIEQFFQSVCKETLEYREKNKEIRPDYMQLLLQIRNEGKINEDGSWNTKIVDGNYDTLLNLRLISNTYNFSHYIDKYKKMPLSDLTAQAFVFFLIGFESTSTTMSFCLFELIKNPELFEKARQNIDMVLKKYNQKITFDSVMEMKYLDYCIDGEELNALKHYNIPHKLK